MCKMQEKSGVEALRTLARGTDNYFPIFILDAGYQTFGNLRTSDDDFKDFREVVDEEGAVFLGMYLHSTLYI